MSIMLTCPVFAPSDAVTPIYTDGYLLTMGRVYTVEAYEPRMPDSGGFTWPAYVHLLDDNGRSVVAHAARFRLTRTTED